MGCTGSRDTRSPAAPAPQHRFGRTEGLRVEDFCCSHEEGISFVKHSGEIMGQQFIVESCGSCNVFLLDHIASMTLDNCNSCFFITGPVSSSLFMRDCRDCTLITVSQQVRLRNCSNIKLFVCSTTGPIIETSCGIGLGCYNYDYTDLPKHFEESKLSPWNNYWYDIYDFTPGVGNFYYLPVEYDPYTQLRASIEDNEISELLPEDMMLVSSPGVDRAPYVLQTRGMVFQSPSQANNLLIIAPDECTNMLRKILYEWINAFGKSFYTVNIKRIESLKHDAGCASFGSLDSSDIHTGLADGETSVQCGGEERSAADRKSSTAGFDHLSSTIVTYHSSGDIDKDPNVVVRTMKRALKKKNLDVFWGNAKKAKIMGFNEGDHATIVQVHGPEAVTLRTMLENEEVQVVKNGEVKNKKGGQIRKVIMYDGVEAIEKIAIVFEQWKDALF